MPDYSHNWVLNTVFLVTFIMLCLIFYVLFSFKKEFNEHIMVIQS